MKPDTNTRKRLVVKDITYQTISNLASGGMAYAMFGDVCGCITFTVICFFVKLTIFYYHERVWSRISWGKKPKPLETSHE